MSISENIFVIEKEDNNKIKIKGSQFIGYTFKINSVADFEIKLKQLKKKFYDASHHCYAYKLNDGVEKYSDDGEPTGTAGIRILNAINHFNLTNILIVIVRYFGGTKLGVGPLGKAYGDSALSLLNESQIVKLTKFEKISISFNYEEVSSIHYLINKYKCRKITNLFAVSPSIECYLEPDFFTSFKAELKELTSDKACFEPKNEEIYLR